MPRKREIPSGASIGLAEPCFASELASHGNTLLCGIEDIPVFRQQVDSGRLHEFIKTHGGADTDGLGTQGVFCENVSGHLHVISAAPFTYRAREGVDEKRSQQIVIIPACSGDFLITFKKEFRQEIKKVIAVFLLKPFRYGNGPRQIHCSGVVIVARFVGKDSWDCFSELAADFAPVGFMRHFDEPFYRIFIHGVEIGFSVEP